MSVVPPDVRAPGSSELGCLVPPSQLGERASGEWQRGLGGSPEGRDSVGSSDLGVYLRAVLGGHRQTAHVCTQALKPSRLSQKALGLQL